MLEQNKNEINLKLQVASFYYNIDRQNKIEGTFLYNQEKQKYHLVKHVKITLCTASLTFGSNFKDNLSPFSLTQLYISDCLLINRQYMYYQEVTT